MVLLREVCAQSIEWAPALVALVDNPAVRGTLRAVVTAIAGQTITAGITEVLATDGYSFLDS